MIKKIRSCNLALFKNKSFLAVTVIYLAVLLLISAIACFFSYRQRKEELLAQTDLAFSRLEQEYTDTVDRFWQVYMPIFESGNGVYEILEDYFSPAGEELSPLEIMDLSQAMYQLMMRDDQIQWIAFVSDSRSTNYIRFNTGSSCLTLPGDFPYLQNIRDKSPSAMEVYGCRSIETGFSHIDTYAICGGVPSGMGSGKIAVGYSLAPYEQICRAHGTALSSIEYTLQTGSEILFSSGEGRVLFPAEDYRGVLDTPKGKLFVNSRVVGTRTSCLQYQMSFSELFFYAHRNTPVILLLVLGFALISLVLYSLSLHRISREVAVIRSGLQRIGENRLDLRIPTDFHQEGLPEIARSINHMTERLSENISRAYHYELRQKEAELSELQAKFNPHFLYNSLEMLRSRCMQSGDEKTAGLITQLAAIFRGFIGSRTFIPLQEELAFSRRYLSLFGARYGDQVQITYNIDTELLRFGVIRNIFQPLIENYFVHGFNTAPGYVNRIRFTGSSLDARTMLLTVEDNGNGMTEEELAALNARLREPITLDKESYGLKNLHQRLSLFYGDGCGLEIIRNQDRGISIQMTVLKMTCGEYEESKGQRE